MIFYMATEQHERLLEFLTEKYILNVNIYACLGADDMLSLVKNELRNTEIEALIIDIGILEDSTLVNTEELVEVFKAFKLLYPESKIVVLTEKDIEKETNEIFFSISITSVSKDLVNILSAKYAEDTEKEAIDEEQEIETQMEMEVEQEQKEKQEVEQGADSLLQEQPKNLEEDIEMKEHLQKEVSVIEQESIERDREITTKDRIKVSGGTPLLKTRVQQHNQEQHMQNIVRLSNQEKDKLKILKQQWLCRNLIVAVIGSERRTGTTTAAFHIAEWLNRSGAKVSYTEANNHFHLCQIAEKENFNVREQHFSHHGIDYYENTEYDQDSGRNFIILDLGSFQENPDWVAKIISGVVDIVILIAGGKTYEQEALDKAVNSIAVLNKLGAIIFNFLREQDFLIQKDRLKAKELILVNSKYEPDLLKPIDVSEIFKCYKSS